MSQKHPNKKSKRPLNPEHRGLRTAKPRRSKKLPPLSARAIRRWTWITALAPVLLIGLGVLAGNPDYGGAAFFLDVLVLIIALTSVLLLAQSGWLFAGAMVLGIAVLAIPLPLFKAELMSRQGVRTEVVVTAVHTSKGKHGPVYSCDLRRTDGKPLKHPNIGSEDCYGKEDLGETKEVLVDPSGWLGPMSADTDLDGTDLGVAGLVVATAGFERIVWLSGRRAQRTGR
ncbi:hypothetical protein [Kitasatospora azatica]|uniref:hypothetical protein n=1 Tax=Kitasatospora azatica TaxID=58347 RepID=UPI00056D2DD6|nr:hypothetical protein [Kitasatospora azatica]